MFNENEVKVVFIGDAGPLFRTAEDAKRRLQSTFSEFSNTRNNLNFSKNIAEPYIKAEKESLKTLYEKENAAKALANGFKEVDLTAKNAADSAKDLTSNLKNLAPPELMTLGNVASALPASFIAASTSVVALGASVIMYSKGLYEQSQRELILQERLTGEHNRQILELQKANAEYDKRLERSREQIRLEEKISQLAASRVTSFGDLATSNREGMTGSAAELTQIRNKAEADARNSITEINRLESELRVRERSLENNQKRGFSSFAPFGDILQSLTGTRLGINRSEVEAYRSVQSDTAYIDRLKSSLDAARNGLLESEATVTRVDEAFKTLSENADKSFAERWEIIKRNNAAAAKFAEEQAANIKRGKERVAELGKTWSETLLNLNLQTNSDNPFVKVFSDAQLSLEKLREDLKGLPLDMQEAAMASQRAFNARQLFAAQIDNAMASFDLREMAKNYRNPFNEQQAQQNRSRWENRFLFESPEYMSRMRDEFEARQRDTSDPISWGQTSFEDFIKKDLQRRSANLFDSPERRARQRLDEQVTALNRLSPTDEAQRALLEQRILRLGNSIDPNNLSGDQRNMMADLADRAAEREERRFQDAMKVSRDHLAVTEQVRDAILDMNRTAERSGTAGVENAVNVNVLNAPDGTQVQVLPKQPTPMTVDFAVGGRGGLSNTGN